MKIKWYDNYPTNTPPNNTKLTVLGRVYPSQKEARLYGGVLYKDGQFIFCGNPMHEVIEWHCPYQKTALQFSWPHSHSPDGRML